MRGAIALLLGVLLCACNAVVTTTALFGPGDAAGAAGLREGVWTSGPDDKCRYNERLPANAWPDCASRLVIKDGQWLELKRNGGPWSWDSTTVLVTAGEPMIVQLYVPASSESPATFDYAALQPIAHDAQGRVTAVTGWSVLCGPPPPDTPSGQTKRYGTLTPLTGLTMDASNDDCSTTSKDAIRAAAVASRQWDKSPTTIHWVRDGDM
jgi:hypothetical protein